MPWNDWHEDHVRLDRALGRLASEGSIDRLAGVINADDVSQNFDQARSGSAHQPRNELIAATTLSRWVKGGLPRLIKAHSHKKRLVYQFLERSRAFQTELYRPQLNLPEGLDRFRIKQHDALGRLRFHDLERLDGVYRLYRRAWTTPERHDRVLVSRLGIETQLGVTFFVELQDYRDDARGGIKVQEKDAGFVLSCGTNLVMIAVGHEAARVKFATIHAWHPSFDGPEPVHELKGTIVASNGSAESPGYRFIAYRTDEEDVETKIVPSTEIDQGIAKWLEVETAGN